MFRPRQEQDWGGGRAKLGLIVNPVAGMGGRVGLKGTDGPEVLAEAWRRGARPISPERAKRALARFATAMKRQGAVDLLTPSGAMGEDAARACGLHPLVVAWASHPERTGPDDTRRAAAAVARSGAALILFAGGDGTARDILDAVGTSVPLLGIPTGVKMHSAVFATGPENAGDLAALAVSGHPGLRWREAEVMDLDEEAVRENRVSARLHGYARMPFERALVQDAKAGAAPGDDETLEATCRRLASTMEPGCLYLLGPGTTTRRIAEALGLPKSLLGVDAVLDRALVGRDLDERGCLDLLDRRRSGPARIVASVIGGQGCLFGRGNQQLSAAVIRRVGRENIIVVTTVGKLVSLASGCLFVDTGDADLDRLLSGYMRLQTGPDRTVVFKVRA